jgi:hypothetical protein
MARAGTGKAAQQRIAHAPAAGGVAVDAHDRHARELARQRILETLGAFADRVQRGRAAARAPHRLGL